MKKIDITDKLSENINPVVVVYGVELEVNGDAKTVLNIMGLANDDEKDEAKKTEEMTKLLFGAESRKKLQKIMTEKNLSFENYSLILNAAMDAATGNDNKGNAPTQGMI